MFRLSEKLKKLEDKLDRLLSTHKKELPKLCGVGVAVLYFYGMAIRSVSVGLARVWDGSTESLITLNPVLNLAAVFTSQGLMISLFVALMYTNAAKGIHTNLRTPLLYPQKRALSTPLLRKPVLSGNG